MQNCIVNDTDTFELEESRSIASRLLFSVRTSTISMDLILLSAYNPPPASQGLR